MNCPDCGSFGGPMKEMMGASFPDGGWQCQVCERIYEKPVKNGAVMSVLVTGSEGVIGRRLVKRLSDVRLYRDRVITMDCIPSNRADHCIANITHPETLDSAFRYNEINTVFHLAASVGRMASEKWAGVALRTNVEGTQHLIDLCLRDQVRFVYVSTSEVYGDAFLDNLVDESTPIGRHLGIYGLSKYMGEELVRLAVDRRSLDAVIIRPFMCYSEDEPLLKTRSAIARMMRQVLAGESLTVHRGSQRSWCYVDDIVQGMIAVGLSDLKGVYNVGRRDPLTMEDVAISLNTIAQSVAGVEVVDMPPGIYPVKEASFDKLERDTGFKAQVGLRNGLNRLVAHHMPLYERHIPRG